jgi:L-asparagine transporter-like permease
MLAVKDIRLSSMLTLILEGLSVVCILALVAIVLFKHGNPVDSAQVHLEGVTVRGMSLAVVACIFSMVGFESATALGAEARNPLHTIPRAVIWSLVLTGLFFVLMGYVEVFGTRGQPQTLDTLGTPLNTLSDLYNVSSFKLPLSPGAMVSFFALSLSCLNSGARIIYPMARHAIFPARLGTVHQSNATPAAALSAYILLMFAVPALWSTQTDVLTVFNGAGTLAAFVHGIRRCTHPSAQARRTQGHQRRRGGARLPVPAGSHHRQLLPTAPLPAEPVPVRLPDDLHGTGRRLAVHRRAPATRHSRGDRNRPGGSLLSTTGKAMRIPQLSEL